jgi:hypothetical protein
MRASQFRFFGRLRRHLNPAIWVTIFSKLNRLLQIFSSHKIPHGTLTRQPHSQLKKLRLLCTGARDTFTKTLLGIGLRLERHYFQDLKWVGSSTL